MNLLQHLGGGKVRGLHSRRVSGNPQQQAAHSLGQLRNEGLKVHQCTGWLPTGCQIPSINNLLCDGAVHAAALAGNSTAQCFYSISKHTAFASSAPASPVLLNDSQS